MTVDGKEWGRRTMWNALGNAVLVGMAVVEAARIHPWANLAPMTPPRVIPHAFMGVVGSKRHAADSKCFRS